VLVVGEFGDAVGAGRSLGVFLADGQALGVTVHRGARGEDHARVGAPGDVQHRHRPRDVAGVTLNRRAHGGGDVTHRRLVEDDVGVDARAVDRLDVTDVAPEDGRIVRDDRGVARGEVVDHGDVTRLRERPRQAAADESTAAGDDDRPSRQFRQCSVGHGVGVGHPADC